jgi:type IV secretion system protein VirD4
MGGLVGFFAFCGALLFCYKYEKPLYDRLTPLRFSWAIVSLVVFAYVLAGLYAGWLLNDLGANLSAIASPRRQSNDFGPIAALFGLRQGSLPDTLYLVFNIWALAGVVFLFFLRANPKGWKRWRRVLLGCLALGVVVGRPFVGWLSWVAPFLPETGVFHAIIYTLGPPILLLLAGGWALDMGLEAIGWQAIAAFGFCVAIPVVLFNQLLQFDQALQVYRQQKSGLIGYVVRFGYWLRGEKMPDTPDDSKGARFATDQETEAIKNPGGMAFGQVDGSPLLLHTEKHVLIMASTRSGKGTSLIIPHLLRYPGSAFVLDPKGENAKATGRQRAALNDKVFYLDPFGISGKPQARFNPLSRFTPFNMEAESKALAAALVMGENGVRDHWTASAQQLVAAIILHVLTSPEVSPATKDLVKVRHLLLKDVDQTLEAMQESGAADGLLSRLASSFLQTPEKEFGSILSTAQRETEILDNPFITACLAASGEGEEVDFADWRKGTMSVFLCLSAPKFPVFSRWLRLVLTSALDEMTDNLNPPALPVCFMLDELATLGHLQPVENAVGLAAGYGIQLVTVFQDVAQMKDLYKGRWASFIGNAGVRALFALDDYDTARYWSQFMGGHLVDTVSEQQDIYGLAKAQSKSETMRPLLSPEEIMLTFAKEKMLILPQGFRPIQADRVPYYQDEALKGRWDDPRVTAA